MKTWARHAVSGMMLVVSTTTMAKGDADREKALDEARKELHEAREGLRRAAMELARATREMDPDSRRARAFELVANPRRAVLGVGIAAGPEKKGEIRGVLITAVTPGSGAEKAGLKSGDVILTANGTALAASREDRAGAERKLRDLMGTLSPGDKVTIEYERDGRTAHATVIAQRPEGMDPAAVMDFDDHPRLDVLLPRVPHFEAFGEDLGGLKLARLDEDLASYFDTSDGVLVVRAPKDALGLKSGDVIQKIDGQPVESPIAVLQRLRKADGQDVALEVLRHGRRQSLKGRWEEARAPWHRRIEIHSAGEP